MACSERTAHGARRRSAASASASSIPAARTSSWAGPACLRRRLRDCRRSSPGRGPPQRRARASATSRTRSSRLRPASARLALSRICAEIEAVGARRAPAGLAPRIDAMERAEAVLQRSPCWARARLGHATMTSRTAPFADDLPTHAEGASRRRRRSQPAADLDRPARTRASPCTEASERRGGHPLLADWLARHRRARRA